jgi:hypothetical protein
MRSLNLGLAIIVCCATCASTVIHAAPTGDPKAEITLRTDAKVDTVARHVLPAGARLLHPAVEVPFGANQRGVLLAFNTADPVKGYAVWYLTPGERSGKPSAQHPDIWQLIRLREPTPGVDENFDIQVQSVMAVGPTLDKHLVLLETFSRPAAAGAQTHHGGSVYRRVASNAQRIEPASQALDGVRDAATARTRLEAAAPWPPPMQARAGGVSAAFLSLPVAYVNLTHSERAERLASRSPWAEVIDEANGYLAIRGDAGIAGYRVALFKRRAGGSMVAVQKQVLDTQTTWFLVQDGPRWRDVSAPVMPGYQASAAYQLPRQGTTVRLGGRDWRWDGAAFLSP